MHFHVIDAEREREREGTNISFICALCIENQTNFTVHKVWIEWKVSVIVVAIDTF